MRTAKRRAREVAARERSFVKLALALIEREGFHNLTLGGLAEESGYSKGTVYNHFTSREDLLIELSRESFRRQLQCFQELVDLPWGSVRQLYGLTIAYLRYSQAHPVLFECSVIAHTTTIRSAASTVRMEQRELMEAQISAVVGSVVRRTVAEGSFRGEGVSPEAAVDAVRAQVLGFSLTELDGAKFLWSAEHLESDQWLRVLTATLHGLGWPALPLDEVYSLDEVVRELVERVGSEYSTTPGEQI